MFNEINKGELFIKKINMFGNQATKLEDIVLEQDIIDQIGHGYSNEYYDECMRKYKEKEKNGNTQFNSHFLAEIECKKEATRRLLEEIEN